MCLWACWAGLGGPLAALRVASERVPSTAVAPAAATATSCHVPGSSALHTHAHANAHWAHAHTHTHSLQVISKDVLRPLMSVLLCCLVDEMVGLLQEGMAMLKALNLLMMKILENSDRRVLAVLGCCGGCCDGCGVGGGSGGAGGGGGDLGHG